MEVSVLSVTRKLLSKLFGVLVVGIMLMSPVGMGARAAELIMFEQAGCHWCAQWNKDIGGIYSKTEVGKQAPLRRIDIHAPIPDDLQHITVERFTPTFVLLDQGEEVGRIRGYPGDEFFWFLLDELVAQLAPAP